MRLVVADTGPINYLVLIDQVDVLPRLSNSILLPEAVRDELSSNLAPPSVRNWILNPPAWLRVTPAPQPVDGSGLHKGEAAAIALAANLGADLVLMDDRRGVLAAERLGLRVTGTLGVLDIAADLGLIDFAEAIRRLESTTFRRPVHVIRSLLAKHQPR